jgi:hypothetical protein
MSDPYIRDIFTISLSPRLASQAPRVNKIRAKVGAFSIIDECNMVGIISTRDNNIPSKQNRDIRRCVRWVISATVAKINGIGIIIYIDIDLMKFNL